MHVPRIMRNRTKMRNKKRRIKMPKYKKKPLVIEAIKFTGDNWLEIDEFIEGMHETYPSQGFVIIQTLEGNMRADIGDYIIKGVNGEFYPCKPDIFEKTYEMINS